jgi:hypothetical protein
VTRESSLRKPAIAPCSTRMRGDTGFLEGRTLKAGKRLLQLDFKQPRNPSQLELLVEDAFLEPMLRIE